MHNLSEGVHNNNFKFEEQRVASSLLPKSINSSLTKILEKSSQRRIIIRFKVMLKLLQDFETLEKYYSDNEYRRRLVSSSLAPGGYYYSPSYFSEYFQLEHIYDQDSDVMEKLNLTENCTIRYEKEAIITI